MADEDIVQNIVITGGDEAAAALNAIGKAGAEAFAKLGEASKAAGSVIAKFDEAMKSVAATAAKFGEGGEGIAKLFTDIAGAGAEASKAILEVQGAFTTLHQGLTGLRSAFTEINSSVASAVVTIRTLGEVSGTAAKITALGAAVTSLGAAFSRLLGPIGLILAAWDALEAVATRVQGVIDKKYKLDVDASGLDKIKADAVIVSDALHGIPIEETRKKLEQMGVAATETVKAADAGAANAETATATATAKRKKEAAAAPVKAADAALTLQDLLPIPTPKGILGYAPGGRDVTPQAVQASTDNLAASANRAAHELDKIKAPATEAHAGGGLVGGAGTGTSDSNLIRASKGEFVVRADGANLNDAIRYFLPGYQGGGFVHQTLGSTLSDKIIALENAAETSARESFEQEKNKKALRFMQRLLGQLQEQHGKDEQEAKAHHNPVPDTVYLDGQGYTLEDIANMKASVAVLTSAGIKGYAGGGLVGSGNGMRMTQPSLGSGGGALGYFALDIRTNTGTIRAEVTERTMDALQSSALASKLSQTGERPSWFS
jgi:hypothetical protein